MAAPKSPAEARGGAGGRAPRLEERLPPPPRPRLLGRLGSTWRALTLVPARDQREKESSVPIANDLSGLQ